MAEDTGWLKKNPVGNPFKMSLRRSNRFYSQDMDGSIMTNEDKNKNQVLVVSHMPRRSNIPIEKIKQMDFKIPAPMTKKSGIKKPVNRMPKFSLGQHFSRPSSYFRPSPSKNGKEFKNLNSKNTNVGSKISTPILATGCLLPIPKPEVVGRVSVIPDISSQISIPSSADLSILSRSKIVNQSTPKDAAVLRTILKQNQGTRNRCNSGKKSKAAKRVNFNCVEKEESNKKGKEEILPKAQEPFLSVDLEASVKTELSCETDDDSTVAFSNSFKPITYEGVESKEDEKVIQACVEDCEEQNNAGVRNNHKEISDSGRVIGNVISMWNAYRRRMNDIWTQLQLNDERFQNNLKSMLENGFQDKFSVYEIEKCKLYDKLKCLEEEFRNEIRGKIDVKASFLRYLEKKVNIYKAKSELEENFEKTLSILADGYFRNDEEMKEGNEKSQKKTPKKSVSSRRLSQVRGKSVCLSGSKAKTASVKRPAKHKITSASSTPESTPARRRKLSTKIEDQIRILFEE